MPRQNRVAEGLIPGSCKIRKRGCSSSSSTSSVLQNYRFKRAILAGKARGSRSGTPVPTWRTAAVLEEEEEHAPSQSGGRSRPVSARKLAATLWEMNEVPSPRMRERVEEKRSVKREMRVRERVGHRSVHSPSLPPHLSDPSHSPVSEAQAGADHNVDVLDSLSSASLMEIETRSRVQTPSGSVVGGGRTRLKDVSNALMTSKELLKIINRIWAHDDQPSSSLSLISALHAELERARLQVNQLIQEQRSDQNEISCLIKCFTEEKAAWKKKEKEVVEAAIESVAGELEVERKLRRRFESLNKKLGKELAETKASLMKAVKELESEKRAREVIEQVCDDLARDVGEDKADVEEMNRESVKMREEVENEREMLHIADKLREERAQMKLSEARHQFEEKNSFVDKLRNQLEGFMRTKRGKQKGSRSPSYGKTDDITAYLSRTHFGSHQNDIKEEDGELEDGADCEEDSTESDIHSIELNMDYNNKSYKLKNSSGKARDSREVSVDDDIKGRIFTTGKASRRSTSLQRSISDGVESGLDRERIYEVEKQAQRRSYGDDMKDYKSIKTLRDQVLSGSRLGSEREFASPTRQWGQAWPSRDPYDTVKEKPTILQGSGLNSRLAEPRGEGQAARRSKR
ncbi:hypothetical protein Acr_08g0018010 [Actinidia rufa]|uniref:Uncharacterized protein n=1 Tax=Actinidia rufa TaxID=165716 RepID=A0A7J0F3Z2_9ERIC|nr:hypothetical protein Acr_08g0018010 [Actinidia rufa]